MIKELLSKGQTDKALQQLLTFLQFNSELENEVIDALSKFKTFQREYMTNRLKPDDFNIEVSKINALALSILKHLEEKFSEIAPSKNVKISTESFHEQLKLKISDKYVIERLLGEGNTAIFYKAREYDTKRFVAIRAMKKQDFTKSLIDKEQPKLNKIYRIKHRHIIKIIGASLGHFPECIMLGYINGIALNRILESGGRPVREVIKTAAQVGDALYYLHTKGITHNKIRPSKILIDEERFPMISPFEILSKAEGESKFIKFREELKYSSPEEILGEEVTDKSDQFCLGLLIYEMLTGKALFEGENVAEIFNFRNRFFSDKNWRNRMIKELKIPARLGNILKELLNESPADRYPNMKVAINQIKQVRIKVEDSVKIALESYDRCCAANTQFAEDFYELLFEKYPELKKYFEFDEEGEVLERRNKIRKRMLRSAISLLLESNQENNYLHKLSKMKGHQGLSEKEFTQFVETIILTAANNDCLWNKKVHASWKEVTSENLKTMIT